MKNKGITLISLVVTIIVLIILAGVSINLILGDNGIIERAKQAKEQIKIRALEEKLNLEKIELAIKNNGKVTVELYIKHLTEKGIIIKEENEILGEESLNIIVDEGYIFLVEKISDTDIKIEYQGKAGKLLPRIVNVETSRIGSNIKVTVTGLRVDEYEYYIKKTGEENYELKETKEEGQYSYENIEETESYDIKVVAKNENGEVELEKTINKPLEITLTAGDVNNKKIILTATGKDNEGKGIKAYEFYVNGELKETVETNEEIATCELTSIFGEHTVYVVVTDNVGNKETSSTINFSDYTIATKAELEAFRDSVNAGNTYEGKTIKQTANIDLQGSEANKWIPIGRTENVFLGIYEGNKYKIQNIYINTTDEFQGLFGRIHGGEIRNIVLSSGTINAGKWTGGIVGYSQKSNITGCENNSTVVGNIAYTGGICGSVWNVIIQNCSNKADVTGIHDVGGIAGMIYGDSTVTGCYNEGNIDTKTEGSNNGVYIAGGIVGYTDNVEGLTTVISNSYNIGTVYGYTNTGGILGTIQGGGIHKLTNCYSIGILSGNEKYGIYGRHGDYNGVPNLEISNNYWLDICGAEYGGYEITNSGATPCKDSQLKGYASTLGNAYKTDINNINNGYPILSWQ